MPSPKLNIAGSVKVALVIVLWESPFLLSLVQINSILQYAQMPNALLPKTNYQSNLF